ncbi:related to YTH1 Protein of the 3` processing complex [Rhynchosporium secalis]|uniref:Related to YTH1 Protein of the 3` processing complex n=1 Tax=Rhynchosporium secalis TaxID=38038 RepID=A0A1E1M978_RHYSE|nr:related to YTH1 Protein of the 3` processing complex [Rhynchosporium secalis]
MASDDHQEMLNKISQLAGQINRHKNGQTSEQQGKYPQSYGGMQTPELSAQRDLTKTKGYPPYNSGWRGSIRGRGIRGARSFSRGGRQNHVYRNKTLVLNASNTLAQSANENIAPLINAGTTNWVTKNDRGHRQLINPAVFEAEKGLRVKSMEETRLFKLKRKDLHERAKLERFVKAENTRRVVVDGGIFRVSKGGAKLERISGAPTPKICVVSGIKFYRSKNGNMYRDASIKISGKAKKTTKPCKAFNLTGIPFLFEVPSFSSCSAADCPFVHDPLKVAVCREFLLKGSCPSGDYCDLSHELTPERTPTCMHFARGNCSKDNCPYTHVRVSPSALVCRSFGIYGYCEKGASCTERHVNECPDFSNTGTCTTEGCKLLHRNKASVMRSNTDPTKQMDPMIEDISSDEEGIGSDDVDSDGMEEFLGHDGEIDEDIPQQQNFVSIR